MEKGIEHGWRARANGSLLDGATRGMDQVLEAKIVQLADLAARGLIDAAELKRGREKALATANDADRVAQGLPVGVPASSLPSGYGAFGVGAVMNVTSSTTATAPQQLQLAPPPRAADAAADGAADASPVLFCKPSRCFDSGSLIHGLLSVSPPRIESR